MFKPKKGFLEVEARVRDNDAVVPAGNMPLSDYFVVTEGNKTYPKGTEIVLGGTAILHKLKSGNWAASINDIIGIENA